MNFNSLIRSTKSVVTANSPALLVGTAIVGAVTTAVLSAKAGYKARGIIDEAQLEKIEPLTQSEKFQLTWMCYAVPAVTGATTIASVIGVHSIHSKRHAALAGVYAITANKLEDYKEKAEELLGPKKTQQLNNEVGQRAVDRSDFKSSEIILLNDGTELCYDEWSGRWFMSSINKIESALLFVNKRLDDEGYCDLNMYYDQLGLSPIESGTNFGWSGPKVEPKFGSVTSPDGRPAITSWFQQVPKEGCGIVR